MDENIVSAIKKYEVKVYISTMENITTNAKTISQNAKAIYVNMYYISGFKGNDLQVKLVITKGEQQVQEFTGLILKEGQKDYVELDAALREELGTGLIKATLFDMDGKFLCNCSTLLTSR